MQVTATAAMNQLRNPNELILPVMQCCKTDNSRQLLQDFYNEMVLETRNPKYNEFLNFMNRIYEHCIRIATTLAAFDMQTELTENYVLCAIGLTRYFLDQRMNLNVTGNIKVNPLVECGKKVIKWLESQPNKTATKSFLVTHGPGCYRVLIGDDRTRVMYDLESRGLIDIVDIPGIGNKNITTITVK